MVPNARRGGEGAGARLCEPVGMDDGSAIGGVVGHWAATAAVSVTAYREGGSEDAAAIQDQRAGQADGNIMTPLSALALVFCAIPRLTRPRTTCDPAGHGKV